MNLFYRIWLICWRKICVRWKNAKNNASHEKLNRLRICLCRHDVLHNFNEICQTKCYACEDKAKCLNTNVASSAQTRSQCTLHITKEMYFAHETSVKDTTSCICNVTCYIMPLLSLSLSALSLALPWCNRIHCTMWFSYSFAQLVLSHLRFANISSSMKRKNDDIILCAIFEFEQSMNCSVGKIP